MQAVGYCRADPGSQATASLEDQRDRIAAEMTRRGWDLIEVFQDICPAHSLRDRDGLDKALLAVESRRARKLVVTDLSRLTTTLDGIAWLMRTSMRRKWHLVSLADQVGGEDVHAWSSSLAAAVAPVIES